MPVIIKSNLGPLALFALALLLLMLSLAGCSTQPPSKPAVSLPPLPPMPPVSHVAASRTMVMASTVVPSVTRTLTLSASTTNNLQLQVSSDLTTWSVFTNGMCLTNIFQ